MDTFISFLFSIPFVLLIAIGVCLVLYSIKFTPATGDDPERPHRGYLTAILILVPFFLFSLYLYASETFSSNFVDEYGATTVDSVSRYSYSAQFSSAFAKADSLTKLHLTTQLKSVIQNKQANFNLVMSIYSSYFALLLIAALSGTVASGLLFYVSKKGWDKDLNALPKGLFILFAIASIFCGTGLTMFDYKNNIALSKERFIKYQMIENDIVMYVTTGLRSDSEGNKVEIIDYSIDLEKYSLKVNKDINKLYDLPYTFSPAKTEEFFKK